MPSSVKYYGGGRFQIKVQFPREYPNKKPQVQFSTSIYHPNVETDTGKMCLRGLDSWAAGCKVRSVLDEIKLRIEQPNFEDAVEKGIGQEYKTNRSAFEAKAKDWTRRYAN